MLNNPKIYELNTRVWIRQFDGGNTKARLSDVPEKFWLDLVDKGFDYVWLMGVWKTCTSIIDKCCFDPDLVSAYNKALKNWKRNDVIGSPYAIDYYEFNPEITTLEEYLELKEKLSKIGLKIVLDFIPNHFGADSRLIASNPELFLQADEKFLSKDPHTFFKYDEGSELVFAHGRDPFFPAWTDTIQLNYFNDATRDFMSGILLSLTGLCDGVRCDMSMLVLSNIFHNTWVGVLNRSEYVKPKSEFWRYAIEKVKQKSPEFLFIAEAYWDLEWEMQQLGFDFTYDKTLTDKLVFGGVQEIKSHLMADIPYQKKSVRFLENHDEQRAVAKLGVNKSFAAAVITDTILGMKLYFDGQLEGKQNKLPLQLGRTPREHPVKAIKKFYDKLLSITKSEIFRKGNWILLNPSTVWYGDNTFDNILAWEWSLNESVALVALNYSEEVSQCRIRIKLEAYEGSVELTDELTGEKYLRDVDEIRSAGLYIQLKAYQSHIFTFKQVPAGYTH